MLKTIVPSINAIIESFPKKPTKIRGIPTYKTLQTLKKDLLINASSVPSTLGGGAYGYLGALLSDAAYAAAIGTANTPIVAPICPGNLPANAQGTQAQITDALRAFDENLRQWREYDNVTKALRNLIINSVEYLSPLANPYSGYNTVSVKDMLNYLFTEYAQLDSNDLIANNKKFDEPWDGSEPFEKIIACIKDCCELAEAAIQPFSPEQILSKAYSLVFNTGLFFDECKKWDELTATQKTFENFCKHFLKAHHQFHNQQRTTKQHGYGLAVEQIQELTANVVHLVNAQGAEKQADRTALQSLTNQQAQIMKDLADMRSMFSQYNKCETAPSSDKATTTTAGQRKLLLVTWILGIGKPQQQKLQNEA